MHTAAAPSGLRDQVCHKYYQTRGTPSTAIYEPDQIITRFTIISYNHNALFTGTDTPVGTGMSESRSHYCLMYYLNNSL